MQISQILNYKIVHNKHIEHKYSLFFCRSSEQNIVNIYFKNYEVYDDWLSLKL